MTGGKEVTVIKVEQNKSVNNDLHISFSVFLSRESKSNIDHVSQESVLGS